MNTVEGVFRILDRASPVLDRIERKAAGLDRTMERVGVRMDEFGTKTERDMKAAQSGVDQFARATERTSGKVTTSMSVMERSISHTTSKAQKDISETSASLAALAAQQANPTIDIDTAGPLAQIALIRKELKSLNNERINIGSTGKGAVASAVSSAMSPQQQKGGFFRQAFNWAKKSAADAAIQRAEQGIQSKVNSAITRVFTRGGGKDEIDATTQSVDRLTKKVARTGGVFGTVGERIWSWTKILLAAGPALESVAGAASALIGSLGGATLGAGVGLTGMLGVATVGFGGLLGSILPVTSKLKESKTALDAYSKSIRTYGRESEEAEKAKRIFERTGSRDARQILGIWGATKRYWRKATKPGQEEASGMIKDMLQTGKQRFLPQFAGISNQSAEASREGNTAFLETLDSPNLHRNLNILSNTFQDISPEAGRTLANAARLITNLAAAARPEVLEFFKWFDKWMRGAQRDTTNLDKLDRKFSRWTGEFKLWVRFFKQLGLLAITFFGAGQKQGNSLLGEWTKSIREQREEWQKSPKGLEEWFDKQTSNFKKLTREIGSLVRSLGELVDMLSALIGPITSVSKTVREGLGGGLLGSVGQIATGAGLYLGAKGLGRAGMRAGAGALGRRLPGKMGEYFLEKAAGRSALSTVATTAAEVGGAGAAGAAASRPSLATRALSRFGPKALKGGLGLLGGYALASAGIKGLGALGVGDPTEGQGIFKSLTHGFATGDGSDEMISPKERYLYELGMAPKAIDKLNPERSQLYSIYNRKYGDAKSFNKALDPTTAALKKAGPKGVEIIASNALMWANAQKRNNPKLEGAYDELVQTVKQRYSKLGQHIAIVNGEIFQGTQSEWGNIRNALTTNVAQAAAEVSKSFTNIQKQAIGSLMGMGYTHQQAANLVKGFERGGDARRDAAKDAASGPNGAGMRPSVSEGNFNKAHGYSRAGGGLIPGMGMQDSVRMGPHRVAPGEAYIATRHQRAEIDQMLPPGVDTLGIISGNKRWHSAPMKKPHRSFAGGGIMSVGQYAAGMGLSVGEGPGFGGAPSGGHATGSLHYSGLAYDVSGAPALMMKFRRAAEQRYFGHGLNELFYDPMSYYIDNGQKVPGAIGGHSDHVHIGFFPGGPSGAGQMKGLMGQAAAGMKFKGVQAPKTKRRGAPGAMAQAGMDVIAAGMNAKLRKHMGIGAQGARGPKGMAGGAGNLQRYNRSYPEIHLGQSGPKLSRPVTESINRWAGLPPTLFYQVSLGESGGYPGMVGVDPGGTEGLGLYMVTTGYNDALIAKYGGRKAMLNPMINAKAASEIYKGSGIGAWYGTSHVTSKGWAEAGRQAGGPVDFAGWMKEGGSFTVKRPTLFGAGEAGEEDVHVVPKGAKAVRVGGGRSGPLVHIEKIENHRPGDIRKQIEHEFAVLGMSLENMVDDEDAVSS